MEQISADRQLLLGEEVVDYPSESSDRIYQVLYRPKTGQVSCNCFGWIYKRKNQPRQCKHTKSFLLARTSQLAAAA